MEKLIYILRHGQTDYNLQGIVQGGGVDTSLNDTGRKQAHAFHEAYKHIPFEAVITSRLKRTHQTGSFTGKFLHSITLNLHRLVSGMDDRIGSGS